MIVIWIHILYPSPLRFFVNCESYIWVNRSKRGASSVYAQTHVDRNARAPALLRSDGARVGSSKRAVLCSISSALKGCSSIKLCHVSAFSIQRGK